MAKIQLSTEQLSELKSMLDGGMKEQDIANHFMISSDALRRIRKENNLMIRYMTCKLCGKIYETTKANRTICPDTHYRQCVVCSSPFVISYDNIETQTCSPKCTGIYKEKQGIAKQAHQKATATWMQNYGVDNPAKSAEVKERTAQSNIEKYGVSSIMQAAEFAERCTASRLAKDESALQTSVDAQRNSMYAKYGGYPAEISSSLHRQMLSTMQEQYGTRHALSNSFVREKIQNTNLTKYGAPWYVLTPECQSSGSVISNINLAFAKLLDKNDISYELEFKIDRKSYDLKVGHTLIEIDPTYTHNSSDNHWHNPLPSMYHKQKSELAKANGHRCIHVFDWDNWGNILELVSPKATMYARNCEVARVDTKTADLFTNSYHIQGKCKGQVNNWGLYYNGDLIQMMTFGRPRYNKQYDFELLRLCTKHGLRVIGGASKLFKQFITENPSASVISYCDLSKFSGDVYSQIGMKLEYITSPAKVWSRDKDHITDNLLRQRGYDQLFHTSHGKGTSNEQLMLDAGWLPVYDCGQAVYSYNKL